MIDEATFELLSRHLDGDLPPAEGRLLEVRLAEEPALAAELEALEQLRAGLLLLADRDRPPAALDVALEPLRRSAPPAIQLRPAFRWLALAATLVVGATVTMRLAQRAAPVPAPTSALRRAAPDPRPSPYQLRPLPTSAVPAGEEPLGVADRLLARALPAPPLPEPPPHTAVGPLNEAERALVAPVPPAREEARGDTRRSEVTTLATARAQVAATAGDAELVPETGGSDAARKGVGVNTPAARLREHHLAEDAARAGTVTLLKADGPVTVVFATSSVDRPGEWRVRVSTRAGVIVAVYPPTTGTAATPLPALLVEELTGLPAGVVADGDYEAAIRVE